MFWQTRKFTHLWSCLKSANRSYAECCIDDVTASHAKRNDVIVKFGHSCFTTKQSHLSAVSTGSETYQKLIIYVLKPVKLAVDVIEKLREQVLSLKEDSVMVYAD